MGARYLRPNRLFEAICVQCRVDGKENCQFCARYCAPSHCAASSALDDYPARALTILRNSAPAFDT
jgi:hypothetical protein